MWTSSVSVLVTIWPLLVEAKSNLLYEYTNGWVPVSNEVVYNQMKRDGAQLSHYIATHNIQLLHTDVNTALSQPTIKIPEEFEPPSKDYFENVDYKCVDKEISNCNQPKRANKPIEELKYDFLPKIVQHNESEFKTVRQSKHIHSLDFNNYVQNLFTPENSSPKSKERTYEVTEDTLELEESKKNNEGYVYEPPKKKTQNNGLFEILSKYKINKDDELPNYSLSRKHKAPIPSKPVPPEKTQLQTFHSYNNLNHLPVDPLIAVFLSNYGYYLQGMYGLHNRYNNLYGYLASNNIHNNRPFGVYKIYSDTDSSH